MVLEKLVHLDFDDRKGKIVITATGEEAINLVQLTGIVILRYEWASTLVQRLEHREKRAPNGANAYLGETFPHNQGVGSTFHPVVYYKIDDKQARRALELGNTGRKYKGIVEDI